MSFFIFFFSLFIQRHANGGVLRAARRLRPRVQPAALEDTPRREMNHTPSPALVRRRQRMIVRGFPAQVPGRLKARV
jgi:hypothetical protein